MEAEGLMPENQAAQLIDVSVILPVYNEGRHIARVLDSLERQTWPGRLNVIVVDNGSTDGTREIVRERSRRCSRERNIVQLNNPDRNISVSLNMACRRVEAGIIIRQDGHTYPAEDYVERLVHALNAIDLRGVVGGRCEVVAADASDQAFAVCRAIRHPFGIGNARYRLASDGHEGLVRVDTVPFGAFPKDLWTELGGYDESLLSSEDYDFNYRARQRGYGVYLDSGLASEYVARERLTLLFGQYFRYGYWTARFIAKHRRVGAVRKAAPSLALITLLVTGLIHPPAAAGLAITYLACASVCSVRETLAACRGVACFLFLVLSFATVHLAYAVGAIGGVLGQISCRICGRRSRRAVSGPPPSPDS